MKMNIEKTAQFIHADWMKWSKSEIWMVAVEEEEEGSEIEYDMDGFIDVAESQVEQALDFDEELEPEEFKRISRELATRAAELANATRKEITEGIKAIKAKAFG